MRPKDAPHSKPLLKAAPNFMVNSPISPQTRSNPSEKPSAVKRSLSFILKLTHLPALDRSCVSSQVASLWPSPWKSAPSRPSDLHQRPTWRTDPFLGFKGPWIEAYALQCT
ncbi:hypothetical protein AVEN_132059-1 [Araneus ventricosus]|uniref:Uncharacterized protein n=1 Tax=Araneus ventricosus TaxID=182803 RepID=A0A4Y2S173_ARAVE|nr:hypothetical protein AVEN_195567-1 [Araneus ventricosus]GBN81716.1 hypothetical protein AVEN_13761-1 [Araneus ventricosus]GBN81722.1 hypothetical protein AVEN_29904-1 [Araneus ventricosus]GBN81737.1 hypothetical protein AVEN_132059-1 [Araneus ventricosus]